MFGTKKIYAKIMNGRLVIRVGGGYMSIDEFMKYHGVQEMQRMQRMQLAEEEMEEIDAADAISKAKGGRRTIGIHQAKAALRGTRTKTKTTTTRTSTKTTRK